MKLKMTTDYVLHVATADGVAEYRGTNGETISLPDDIAAQFITAGVAAPIAAERATKPAGKTATK